MVKRSAPAPSDMSRFYGTFLSNSYTVTRDLTYFVRRLMVLHWQIGFMLNADLTGERANIGEFDTGNGDGDMFRGAISLGLPRDHVSRVKLASIAKKLMVSWLVLVSRNESGI